MLKFILVVYFSEGVSILLKGGTRGSQLCERDYVKLEMEEKELTQKE